MDIHFSSIWSVSYDVTLILLCTLSLGQLTSTQQLDYTAGVLPVTHVDKTKDQLPSGFRLDQLNAVARGAYVHYNAENMHGLPVGVQVVGKRLEEEKVLAIMQRIEDALEKGGNGGKYQGLEVE